MSMYSGKLNVLHTSQQSFMSTDVDVSLCFVQGLAVSDIPQRGNHLIVIWRDEPKRLSGSGSASESNPGILIPCMTSGPDNQSSFTSSNLYGKHRKLRPLASVSTFRPQSSFKALAADLLCSAQDFIRNTLVFKHT